MMQTTLCYLKYRDTTLMLLRNKKEHDLNAGKWIGVGGKLKEGEYPGDCLKREVKEETGIELSRYVFRGRIYFSDDRGFQEEMFLYEGYLTDEQAAAVPKECDEGTFNFIKDEDIPELELWEGDRIFLKDMLDGKDRISYRLTYEGDRLKECENVPLRHVLFDMDGTLADTGEGIMKSAAYALESIGIKTEDPSKLSFFVGPPLVHTFTTRYGVDEAKARELVEKYRERYKPVGLYESRPYPGAGECIEKLRDMGYTIGVASSKPEAMCRELLRMFSLTELFDDVTGATPDGRIDTKSQVLAECFRKHQEDPFYGAGCVLIGDTAFDIEGASNMGIASIGVSYGYGSVEDMERLGAAAIADSMAELPDIIESISGGSKNRPRD